MSDNSRPKCFCCAEDRPVISHSSFRYTNPNAFYHQLLSYRQLDTESPQGQQARESGFSSPNQQSKDYVSTDGRRVVARNAIYPTNQVVST